MAAVPHLSQRCLAVRFQLFDRQLSAHRQPADRRLATMDSRAPRHDDDAVLRHRHLARGTARLAASAALDALADAAALGFARHSVFSARTDPDLPAGLPAAAVAGL